MAFWALDTAANLIGAGFSVYSHKKSLQQDKLHHEHDCALAAEQHFQEASLSLLAIAKEADREVWEQRNNQFNNMLVCATLMFGVPINNINQGAYHETEAQALEGEHIAAIFKMDGLFVVFTGVSVGSLFVCIAACFVVTRRMSSYMIERSAHLVERLAVSTDLAHELSSSAKETACGDPSAGQMHQREKSVFHERIGAAINSCPKQAQPSSPPTTPKVAGKAGPGESSGASLLPKWGVDEVGNDETASSYRRFVDRAEPPRPPSLAEARSRPSAFTFTGPRLYSAPLNFSHFYREHCSWLDKWVTWSFVVGVLSAWASTWFLLWNEFQHGMLPVILFGCFSIIAIVFAGALERGTKRSDGELSTVLRRFLRRYSTNVNGDGSHRGGQSWVRSVPPNAGPVPPEFSAPPVAPQWLPASVAPSPPPSPPPPPPPPPTTPPLITAAPQAAMVAAPAAATRPPAAARLREARSLWEEGLLTPEEYRAKREEIVAGI